MKDENKLQSICKNHPNAEILHEWDNEKCVWGGVPRGIGINKNHRYYCSVCHIELCSPEEYERRIKAKEN